MALSFNGSPYFDDYDSTKGFLKILYKPGYAVQARELTQSQDILQNQIGNFGSYVFKSGSPVVGGQITLDTNVTYANLNPIYANSSINEQQFLGKIVTDSETQTIRASVIAVVPQLSPNPPTLMMKYLTGLQFNDGANITVYGSSSGPFALLANTNSTGNGSCVSLTEGVFYLNLNNLSPTTNTNANTVSSTTNAYFVNVPQQTIVLDAYDNKPTYMVGLQISDSIVTTVTNSSLLDPALGSSNYQAPGADRYIINAKLSSRQLNSQDLTSFVQLLTVSSGQLQSITTSPQLSGIMTTLAKRTQDQSGSFTVKPFRLTLLDSANSDSANSNSQIYYASVGPGNAYVDGFNYQTISKTYLNAPRARTIANVSSYTLQSYFGNYVLVDTVNGEFNFSILPSVDLHCVNWANVVVTNTNAYANSLIGTARLRSFEYDNALNTTNGLSYVFRAGLFHINTSPIIVTVASSTATTVTFNALAQTTQDAYSGMSLVIPSSGDTRFITSYNGASRTATVSSNFSVNPSINSPVNIISNLQSIESIGLNTMASFITANCNINIGSKNQSNTYNYVSFSDTNFTPLVFKMPNSTIAQGLQSPNYNYRARIATSQTLTPGTPLIVNLNIPGDTSATFASGNESASDLLTLSDFLLVTNPGGGIAGSIIPMVSALGRNVSTTTTTATFTTNATDPTFSNVDIFASIKSTIGAKTKTLIKANTSSVVNTGGTNVESATVYPNAGQIAYRTPYTTNLVNPGIPQDLYLSDGITLVAVIDSGNPGTEVTDAMVQAAANNSVMPTGSYNVTNNYIFSNGQTDTIYDHATITLNPGAPLPIGELRVLLNYYSPSTTGGYFSVDSYPDYATIPIYMSPNQSTSYYLRDCIDWRPVRDASTTNYSFTNAGIIFLPEPIPSNGFTISYGYYLGRIDRLVLTKTGQFSIVLGSSSLNPQPPILPKASMLLYTMVLPPYTYYAANVVITQQNNQRYTMADIGQLEKRIQTLEYYNSLSQVEQAATNQNITDSNGVVVPQLGLLVDAFTGSSIANVLGSDYAAAIDGLNQQLRPSFNVDNSPLVFAPESSSHYQKNGKILTLPYTTTPFVSQNAASRAENLNPFNLTVWNGNITLTPDSDTWVSTDTLPAVTTNLSGDNNSWQAAKNAVSAFGTSWNSWQTVYAGISTSTTAQVGQATVGSQQPGVYTDAAHAEGGYAAYQVLQPTITTTTTTTAQNQTRTGVQLVLSTDNITIPIGDRIVSVSVIPYMRTRSIAWYARSMKPLTPVYQFLDNLNVTSYSPVTGTITFTSNVDFNYQDLELLVDTDGGTNGGYGPNTASITLSKGNIAYVSNVHGVIYPGKALQGAITGNIGTVKSFSFRDGFGYEPAGDRYKSLPWQYNVTPAVDSTSIALQGAASNTDGYYVGNTIYINYMQDHTNYSGLSSNIVAYNGASRICTLNPALPIPSMPQGTIFYYSIGSSVTDASGDVAGSIWIPDNTNLTIPTGTSTFLVTDSKSGIVADATTKSQGTFTSQGTLDTTQAEYISTAVPVITTRSVTQNQVVTNSQTTQTVQNNVIGYVDPLAQSFIIDSNVYPNGVFITSVRICFYSVDPVLPVTMQLRPMDNGFPSSSNIIPFSEVTLLPNQCNVSSAPSLATAGQYTEFVFSAPILLLPGNEFAIVLISNSNNYQVYTAAVGDAYLGSTQLISQPPYLGVMFKSQNSSTWTPYQGESLMFSCFKAKFDNSESGFVTFKNPSTMANNPLSLMPNKTLFMDTMYVTNNDQTSNNSSISYAFRGTSNTTLSLDSSYTSFIPNQNYSFQNRYAITPSYGSFWLQSQLQSPSTDISPIIDISRYSIMTVQNIINNGSIGNNDIVITNAGEGYNLSATNIVTLTNGKGAGATLDITSVNANGNVIAITVPTNDGGSSYTQSPTLTITTSGYSPTIVATAVVSGETGSVGGNFLARYMTRSVTLSPGIEAGNLQVYLDAYLPQNTNIYVYYKILSSSDITPFVQRPWVLMQIIGTQTVATIPNSFTTYQYVGAVDQYGNPINSISYGGYHTFNQFAIKIVMASSNPSIVPLIKNLRAFALPSAA